MDQNKTHKELKIGTTVFVKGANCWDKIKVFSEDGRRFQTEKGYIVETKGYIEIWDPSS